MTIRSEIPEDADAIRQVHTAAFGQPDEADLVDRLRAEEPSYLGLTAIDAGDVVGHIAFTPVTIGPEAPPLSAAGLAPMAVLPEHQRAGIGSALIERGLEVCRARGIDAVFVLGHPAYYPRFGFGPTRTNRFTIQDEYGAPADAFMVVELTAGGLTGISGTVSYASAFES